MTANKNDTILDFSKIIVTMQIKNLKSVNLLIFPFQVNFQGRISMSFGSYEIATTFGSFATTMARVVFLIGLRMVLKMSLFSSKAMMWLLMP